MKPQLLTRLAQHQGTSHTCVLVQDPVVHMEHYGPSAHVSIEEGGVLLEIVFPDVEAVERFQQRVARLRVGGAA